MLFRNGNFWEKEFICLVGRPLSAAGEEPLFSACGLFLFRRGMSVLPAAWCFLPTASYFSLAGKVCKSAHGKRIKPAGANFYLSTVSSEHSSCGLRYKQATGLFA